MNKKLLTILLILVVAATAITYVSAAETVTVHSEEFNVPDGYTYNAEDDFTFTYDNGDTLGVLAFLWDGTDMISISVLDNFAGDTLDGLKAQNSSFKDKTISGKEGIIAHDDEDGSVYFEYIENGKIITIHASKESLIEKTII